jgi:ribosomal 30S subunit maturation factor RimM
VDAATGWELGRVESWQACGGPPLLETKVNGREVLIPFVAEICREVDLTARTIRVELPEGLLDL